MHISLKTTSFFFQRHLSNRLLFLNTSSFRSPDYFKLPDQIFHFLSSFDKDHAGSEDYRADSCESSFVRMRCKCFGLFIPILL